MVLSKREHEVAGLVAEGLSNRAIGERLFLSERTIEGHVEHALNKLGFNSRSQLAAWVARAGSATPSEPADSDLGLPQPLTRFVGRRSEVADLCRRLASHRLVTVVGPGGVGKTRLAIEAAGASQGFPVARMAELGAASSAESVASEVSAALGLSPGDGWGPALATRYGRTPALLVLDNCEHVVEAAAELAQMILKGSRLTLLATSREPLGVEGELVVSLAPLSLEEAVELFDDRATEASSTVADAKAICARLDRIPLAIELAAARTRVMSGAALAASLDRALSLLSAGPRSSAPRQRSLEASVDWSYQLLSPSEQCAFRALGVFAAGFDLAAAAAVAGESEATILGLVDRSMLAREVGDTYRMLEPVRQFARARLADAGEEGAVIARHDAQLLEWAGSKRDALVLRERPAIAAVWGRRADIVGALERLESSDPGAFAFLGMLYARAGLEALGRRELDRQMTNYLAACPADHPQRAFITYAASNGAWGVGDTDRQLALATAAIDLARTGSEPLIELRAAMGAALALGPLGRREEEVAALNACLPLAESLGPAPLALVLNSLGMAHWQAGQYVEGEAFARRALVAAPEASLQRCFILGTLAGNLTELGRVSEAAAAESEGARLMIDLEAGGRAPDSLFDFARIAARQGRVELAATLVGAGGALATRHQSVVEDPIWDNPEFAAQLGEHAGAAAAGAQMNWREALEFAIDAFRPAS